MYDAQAFPGAFSAAECAAVAALAGAAPAREAGLVGGASDPQVRRAELRWLDDAPGSGWVMDRLIELVRAANRELNFDVTDFAESAQLARYTAERGGHFDWHTDAGGGPLARRRKLTVVVQLSEPADYAGGALELLAGSRPRQADTARGAAIVFPSFVLHRVSPVTAGERLSLTVWAHGPSFR